MRTLSIRARLTLWYTSLLTITLLVLGGVAYGLLGYGLAHDMDIALQGVAQALAENAPRGANPLVPADIDALFRRFFGVSPWDRFVERRDPLGQRDPLWQSPRAGALPLSPQARRNTTAGKPTFETMTGGGGYPVRVLTQPIIVAGRVTDVIRVGMSQENLYATRRRFLLSMSAVLPLGLLLAGGGGWLLARRALAPVDRMAAAAQRISAAHLAERLHETGSGDELDRLASMLNAMLSRLDTSFTHMRQFSADASHELQTPLTILQGELEVALRAPRSPKAYQQVLISALEEIQRIATLVEGLLLLARADAGMLRMDQQPVDLAQLITEVYEQTQILATARAITLDLGPLEPVIIQGDRDRLRRLVLNLVDNGIKYTAPSGRVTLSLHHSNGGVLLQVTDTGMGLSPADQERIFQRFYRTTAARDNSIVTAQGSGLGLCIARSIAEAHGGTLHVSSCPGQGSTFTLLLPTQNSPTD